MAPQRVQRTHDQAPRTVKRVREFADGYEESESAAWEAAASDPAFLTEAGELEAAYRGADRETWPA